MLTLSKFIPIEIRIKTLFWVRKEKEIQKDFSHFFKLLDEEKYLECSRFLNEMEDEWQSIFAKSPHWFTLEYTPEFTRARTQLAFLKEDLE